MSAWSSFSQSKKTKQNPQTKATHCTTKGCQETGLNTNGTIRSFKTKKKKLCLEAKNSFLWEKLSTLELGSYTHVHMKWPMQYECEGDPALPLSGLPCKSGLIQSVHFPLLLF